MWGTQLTWHGLWGAAALGGAPTVDGIGGARHIMLATGNLVRLLLLLPIYWVMLSVGPRCVVVHRFVGGIWFTKADFMGTCVTAPEMRKTVSRSAEQLGLVSFPYGAVMVQAVCRLLVDILDTMRQVWPPSP